MSDEYGPVSAKSSAGHQSLPSFNTPHSFGSRFHTRYAPYASGASRSSGPGAGDVGTWSTYPSTNEAAAASVLGSPYAASAVSSSGRRQNSAGVASSGSGAQHPMSAAASLSASEYLCNCLILLLLYYFLNFTQCCSFVFFFSISYFKIIFKLLNRVLNFHFRIITSKLAI